jgi:hypothetical protein
MLEHLLKLGQTLSKTEELCRAIRTLNASSTSEQMLVLFALRANAHLDPGMGEGMWELVRDAQWRHAVLASLENEVLVLLLEALSVLLVRNRGQWASLLPHFLAEAGERAEDSERRRMFFLFVVHLGLAAGGVSAIRRLLRGEQRSKFAEFAEEYRKNAEDNRAYYPPWVTGKLRHLVANLHVQ